MSAAMILLILLLIGGGFVLLGLTVTMHYIARLREGPRRAAQNMNQETLEELRRIREELEKLSESQMQITLQIDDLQRNRLDPPNRTDR